MAAVAGGRGDAHILSPDLPITHGALSHSRLVILSCFVRFSLSQSVSRRRQTPRPRSPNLQLSLCSAAAVIAPQCLSPARPRSPTCQPQRLLSRPRINAHRLSSVRPCTLPSSPPPCGHGWSSDTNEAPPGDNQCPPDCKRLHVCLRGPPPPPSLSDCKQASGVPHRRRNNKKGDLRAFSSVCVCVFTRACGPLTPLCFLPLLFTRAPPPHAPQQFPPSPWFFSLSFFRFRRAAKP